MEIFSHSAPVPIILINIPGLNYCLAQIPDELLEQSQKGLNGLIGRDPSGDKKNPTMYYLYFLDTMDLNSVVHGSRKSMQPFESPFIGWTDDECRSWMNEHQHPYFSRLNFLVLDKDTVKKTCRVGYMKANESKGDQMLIADFYTCMHVLPGT